MGPDRFCGDCGASYAPDLPCRCLPCWECGLVVPPHAWSIETVEDDEECLCVECHLTREAVKTGEPQSESPFESSAACTRRGPGRLPTGPLHDEEP
jgi:hypothetical protein